jgi:16S rRNA C1402 (ribose-2'-O) methylase RsmI
MKKKTKKDTHQSRTKNPFKDNESGQDENTRAMNIVIGFLRAPDKETRSDALKLLALGKDALLFSSPEIKERIAEALEDMFDELDDEFPIILCAHYTKDEKMRRQAVKKLEGMVQELSAIAYWCS